MSSTASPLGAEILVNTRTTGTEVLPAVAVLTGGSFVVTWSDLGSTSGDIRARLFNAAGQPLGDEFAVNSNSVIEQNHPRVAALANGGFVIVWQDSGEPLLDTDETSIKLQRFDAAGNKLGGEKLVNQFITGDQLFPTVTALAGGGFVVTFEDYSGLYNDGLLPAIVAQAFDDNGVSLTNQFRVNQEPYQAQNLPEVAGLAGGDFVAVWEDWSGRIGDTAVSGIALQRVSASGGYVGGEVLVNTTTASFQRDPSVAALAGGGFVVAWEDESGGGAEGAVIRAQRFDASGVKQGTEFLVNTTTAGTQTDPVAVGLAGGGFVIGWHDTSNAPGDGSIGAVRAQLFDAGGVRVGSEMLLNHTTQGLQWQLALAAQGDGGFIAAWTDNSRAFADPVGSAIVAQRFALGDPSPGDDTLDLSGPGGGTVAGGSGDDIYIVDDPADNPVELPGSGVDTVQSSISWVLSAEFEALVLTGTADIDGTGNALANTISGNSGRNLLDGGAGADTLIGGAGGDTYLIDDPGDTVIETANAGALPLAGAGGRPTDAGADADTIVSSLGRAVLSAYVESGVLAEGSAAREMLGNALANIIDGNSAANLLQGGPGDDTLNGGEGIDVAAYAGDRARYTVTVNAQTVTVKDNGGDTGSEGLDTLNSIEVLLFADQVMPLGGLVLDTGTTGTDILALTDLAAQAGAGGAGNDTYETGTTADAVLELDGEGVDTVRSQADWTLWDNLEHLVLTGAALTGAGNAAANAITGNALGNRLWGYAGNDTLDGGAGTDTLRGGAGNDLYEVGAGDVIEEQPGDGIDTVRSAISWALAAETEKLVLTGSTAANGIGNALANTLTGNVATNRLDGGGGNDTLNGGAGIDTLVGGAGNDTYVVTSNDKLVESKNNGADTVQSAVTWTLAVNLEKLTLTGSAAVNGTGNTGANTLAGNAAANLLKGAAGNDTLTGAGGNDTLAGGSGSDRLSGGTGADTFAFDTAPAAGNRDTITDFTTGSDRIRLDDDVFSAFAASQSTTLAAGALRVGAGTNAAQDADDRILYDTASGALYYDADGTGPVAAVQFAVLGVGTHPSLGATDFLIFD